MIFIKKQKKKKFKMADDIDFLDQAFAIARKKDKTIMDNFFDK